MLPLKAWRVMEARIFSAYLLLKNCHLSVWRGYVKSTDLSPGQRRRPLWNQQLSRIRWRIETKNTQSYEEYNTVHLINVWFKNKLCWILCSREVKNSKVIQTSSNDNTNISSIRTYRDLGSHAHLWPLCIGIGASSQWRILLAWGSILLLLLLGSVLGCIISFCSFLAWEVEMARDRVTLYLFTTGP